MRAETPSVLLIYTGGTIGMIENPETGALENFNFDHLLKHVPELKRFNYRISSYQFNPPIDSSDMEPAYWAKLVKIINYNYDYFDGFVILHGTDTMAYTASALSFMLENLSKPAPNSLSELCVQTGKKISSLLLKSLLQKIRMALLSFRRYAFSLKII